MFPVCTLIFFFLSAQADTLPVSDVLHHPPLLIILSTEHPAAAGALSTGSQEGEEEKGGNENAEPENAEHLDILKTQTMVTLLVSEIYKNLIFTTKLCCTLWSSTVIISLVLVMVRESKDII